MESKPSRIIALTILLGVTVLFSIFAFQAVTAYNEGADRTININEDISIEIIRTTADDGTPLKALLYVSHENEAKTDHSVPLIMGCHGMSGNFWAARDFYYTLAKRGYAVIAPEFRGHGSNPAPSTLGSKEPWDILTFLDYAEDNIEFIDVYTSGIYGHSMGGLYATSAYYFEGLGKARLKALVDLSGPTNISREIATLTDTPSALGDVGFMTNITEKSPVDFIPEGSLQNVYIAHGTDDIVVAYGCSVDLYDVLDPDDNRDDIIFDTVEGGEHEINEDEILQNSTAWLDKYVLGISTDPSSVVLLDNAFSDGAAKEFTKELLKAAVCLIPMIVLAIFVMRPSLFNSYSENDVSKTVTKKSEEKIKAELDQLDEKSDQAKDDKFAKIRNILIKPLNRETKSILILLYIGVAFLAGLVGLIVKDYIVTELMIMGVFSTVFVGILYYFGPEYLRSEAKKWFNWKSAIIWMVSIIVCLYAYAIIPSLQSNQDALLFGGVRICWWVPFFASYIAIQVITNAMFVRFLQGEEYGKFKNRIGEMFISGLLTIIMLLVFWFNRWGALLTWEWAGFSANIIPLVAIGVGLGVIIFDLIAQIGEKFAKTIVLGALACGITAAMFIGNNWLIFWY